MNNILAVAGEYREYSMIMDNAHHLAAHVFDQKYKWLGIPSTVISAIVGSSIFASLASNDKIIWLIIATGMMSICAAILSALQTFLRYSELAQAHKVAAAGYEAIRHKLDIFKLKVSGDLLPIDKLTDALEVIANELNALSANSPGIPDDIYDKSTGGRKPSSLS